MVKPNEINIFLLLLWIFTLEMTVPWFNWYIFRAVNYYRWTRARKTKGKDLGWGLGPPLRSQDGLESRRWGRHNGPLYERRCLCRCRVADGSPRSRVPLAIPSRNFNKTQAKKRNEPVPCISASRHVSQARLYKHACMHHDIYAVHLILAHFHTDPDTDLCRETRRQSAKTAVSERK